MYFFNVYFQLFLWSSSGFCFLASALPASHRGTSKRSSYFLPHRVNCSAIPNATREEIENSAYYLLSNGSLCCPPKNCQNSKDDMVEICGAERGIVNDPCHHCMTCGKKKGESCQGIQFTQGQCGPNLSCINSNGTVMIFEYDEGVCTDTGGAPRNLEPGNSCGGKFGYLGACEPQSRCIYEPDKIEGICVKDAKTKSLGKKCGGRYGVLGRCAAGYRCSKDEDEFLKGKNITGICYRSDSQDVCFKDCSVRNTGSVCGDDKILYENICYMRQKNCNLSHGETKVRKHDNLSYCTEGSADESSTSSESS